MHADQSKQCGTLRNSIWFAQAQFAFRAGHAQAGENPELRVIFFKLAYLLQFPITPLFVFDGPGRPPVKRGVNVVEKPHWLTLPMKELLDGFRFSHYTASKSTCIRRVLLFTVLIGARRS
jgi:XPG N-terminal domain